MNLALRELEEARKVLSVRPEQEHAVERIDDLEAGIQRLRNDVQMQLPLTPGGDGSCE